jgi:hypothetical protein
LHGAVKYGAFETSAVKYGAFETSGVKYGAILYGVVKIGAIGNVDSRTGGIRGGGPDREHSRRAYRRIRPVKVRGFRLAD